jgi:uncharacterized protein YneF (UPF0154 family)
MKVVMKAVLFVLVLAVVGLIVGFALGYFGASAYCNGKPQEEWPSGHRCRYEFVEVWPAIIVALIGAVVGIIVGIIRAFKRSKDKIAPESPR